MCIEKEAYSVMTQPQAGYASKAAVVVNVPHADHTEEDALDL